jgi:DNA-binding transcriptional regulator YiaG
VAFVTRTEISEHIRATRGRRTCIAFAKALNVTRQTIYNWENGNTLPPVDKLDALGLEIQKVRLNELRYEPVEATD